MTDRPSITVLLGDPRLPDAAKPGGRFTADDLEQVQRLHAALATLSDYAFTCCDDHTTLLDGLRGDRPSLVLNFCDTGYRNQAARELHVPAYLEMLEIPYSGTGPVGLGLCYDKAFVRAVAAAHAVPVPWERFVRADQPIAEAMAGLTYPAFIKPNRGDGSVGITARSIVTDAAAATACIEELRDLLPGTDLIAQEFLSGDEFGIGVLGNPSTGGLDVLPPLEVDYSRLDASLPRLLDYGSKTDPDSPYWTDVVYREARLPAAERADMTHWCELLFDRLGLRDYARFDFRRNAAGEVKLMEVNPNPAWCHDGKLAHMASLRGDDHATLLGGIIAAARARVGAGG